MGEILTFDDVKDSDSWRKQIQLSSTFASTFSDKPVKAQNLTLHRRNFDGGMKDAFRELTKFYLDKYEVGEGETLMLYGEGAMMRFYATEGTDALSSEAKCAAQILEDDLSEFERRGGRGSYIRLRLQGGNLFNGDSVWHYDGPSNIGIRYSGAMTQEAHDDDIISISRNEVKVSDEARILVAEHGDVWRHNAPSRLNPFSTMKPRVHRKAPEDAEPGLILTMQ